MAEIFVEAPPEQVFEAISDLTHHAGWAVHPVKIQAAQSGPAEVGSRYTSGHEGQAPDQVVVTELVPNELFAFRVTLPNGVEFQHAMTVVPEAEGARVTRKGKLRKLPGIMLLLWPLALLVVPRATGDAEVIFLDNMKRDLERNAS